MTTQNTTSKTAQSSQIIDTLANQDVHSLMRPWLIYYPYDDYLDRVPVLIEIDGQELCVISGYALVGDCGWSNGKCGRTVRIVCEKALSLGFTFCTLEIAEKLSEKMFTCQQDHPLHGEHLWIPTQPINSTKNYIEMYLLWNNCPGNKLRLTEYGEHAFADNKEGSALDHWVFVKPRKQETAA